MLATGLSLPVSQYYCVTTAAISEIYSKRVYSSVANNQLVYIYTKLFKFSKCLVDCKFFIWYMKNLVYIWYIFVRGFS